MQVRKIADAKSLALHYAEPLLYLVHPGTMRWEEVADKAGMERQPVLSLFAMMDTRIIEHKKDASNRGWKLLIELGEQRNELDLPLAHGEPKHHPPPCTWSVVDRSRDYGSVLKDRHTWDRLHWIVWRSPLR